MTTYSKIIKNESVHSDGQYILCYSKNSKVKAATKMWSCCKDLGISLAWEKAKEELKSDLYRTVVLVRGERRVVFSR